MSPVKACGKHGRPRCGLCATEQAERRRAGARRYSNTAGYRQMREQVIDTYGVTCVYCHRLIEPGDEDGPLVLAHVIAHADGGAFELHNLRPAHDVCNKAAGR